MRITNLRPPATLHVHISLIRFLSARNPFTHIQDSEGQLVVRYEAIPFPRRMIAQTFTVPLADSTLIELYLAQTPLMLGQRILINYRLS